MIRFVRVHRGYLQTPVRAYRHPITGQRVTVVGMMHVGQPAYYKALEEVIYAEHDRGSIVQYEAVLPVAEDQLASMTDLERQAIEAMRGSLELYDKFSEWFGWSGQMECLPYDPSWQSVDLNILELVRLMDPAFVIKHFSHNNAQQAQMLDDPATAPLMRVLFSVMYRSHAELWLGRFTTPPQFQHAVVDQRNLAALNQFFAIPSSQNVVLMWGAAHLPGIDQALQAAGLRLVDETWYAIGRLPPVLANLRQAAKALRAAARSAASFITPTPPA